LLFYEWILQPLLPWNNYIKESNMTYRYTTKKNSIINNAIKP